MSTPGDKPGTSRKTTNAGAGEQASQAGVGMDTIASRLRKVRKFRGLSLADLASKIGSSSPTISAIENGRQNIGLKMLIKVCDELRVSLDWIVYGENAGYRYNPAASTFSGASGVTSASPASCASTSNQSRPSSADGEQIQTDEADTFDSLETIDTVEAFGSSDDKIGENDKPHDPEPHEPGLDDDRISKSEFLKFQAELYDRMMRADWQEQ